MTDNGNLFTGQQHTASVTAYRADGWKVYFSFVLDNADPVGSANTQIAALAAGGYTPNAPGMKPGEHRENVGAVVRYNKKNKDGSVSPRIFFYSTEAALVHKMVDTYLDTPEQRAEFERVSGLSVAFDLPVWTAKAAPQRDDAEESGVLAAVKRPFAVVFIDNPDYVQGSMETTKYNFVRYESGVPNTDAPAPNVTPFTPPQTGNALDAAGIPSANAGKPVPPAMQNALSDHWTKTPANVGKFFKWAGDEFELNTPKVLEILNVKAMSQYTGSYDDAQAAVTASRMPKASGQ